MILNWKLEKAEHDLIDKIVKRALLESPASMGLDVQGLHMDLTACHNHGMPLDFEKLLAFPKFDFFHDIIGIANHINRTTGQIERCFVPRCAK